jgi:hypothetical protein
VSLQNWAKCRTGGSTKRTRDSVLVREKTQSERTSGTFCRAEVHLVRCLCAKGRMWKHPVVFLDAELDQSTDGGDVQRVKEEPLVLSERHHASIMEFESFSFVKAKIRRSTPVVIRASTWAFTFSTPASANTTRVVSEGVAPRLASTSTATLFAGAERLSDSPRQNPVGRSCQSPRAGRRRSRRAGG